MLKNIIFIALLISVISCKNGNEKKVDLGEKINNKYSQGFEILKTNEGYLLKVKNRFDKNYFQTYSLAYDSKNKTEKHIKIPVKNIICLSTTYCAFISELQEIESISGISGTNFIYNRAIKEKIAKKEIIDVGYERQIKYEQIISLKPDVVFAYIVDNKSISVYQKLIDIGIPVVYVGDFLENNPLGRSEWLKFFACFFNKLEPAIKYFDSLELKYNHLLDEIKNKNDIKPNVLVGLPYNGNWWVPGGNSFFANFISHAGGNYIYNNNNSSESIPHSIEYIFKTALNVDIWLHPNEYNKKEDITKIDKRLKNFNPFISAKIYNNNKRINKHGGNDFWESGVTHPDIILNDLYKIFYNKDASDLFYYKKL